MAIRKNSLTRSSYDVNKNHNGNNSDESVAFTEMKSTKKPLKRLNRLLRGSLSWHWPHFKRDHLRIARGRSMSEAGLCMNNANDGFNYLGVPIVSSNPRLSLQLLSIPLLQITSAGAGVEEASDDGSETEHHSKRSHHLRVPTPALPAQSTGNFSASGAGGCGAARSAPVTPLLLDPSPRPERSSKSERNAVKPLSSSTSSVPATLGVIAAEDTDGASGKQPSKSRQKKFHRHFPQVGPEEKVLNYYSCALVGEILLQGHLYITKNYFAFYSNVFGYVTKLLIPTISVHRITKEKVARIIPNAVGVSTRDERHVFGSLLSRDTTYKLMVHVWKAATASQAQELRASEVELDASEYSPEDDSSSAGADTAPPSSPRRDSQAIVAAGSGAAVIQPLLLTGASTIVPRAGTRGGAGRALLVMIACVFACSALALATQLYRVRYSQDELSRLSGHQLYSELTRWRSRLHGQAATELHSFLSANLMLLTKVRQSLEALSGVILTDMAQAGHTNDVPNDTGFS